MTAPLLRKLGQLVVKPSRKPSPIQFGAMAEFERNIIRERTKAGLEAARARGRVGGRPTVMTPQKLKMARDLYDSKEYTVQVIATELGVSRRTIYRSLSK